MKNYNKAIKIVNAYVMQMLAEMDNSSHTHKVILALMDEFGDERVYDESQWTFGKPELERIYKVLNETAFENKLRKNIPIYYGTANNIAAIIKNQYKDDDFMGEGFHGLYHVSYKTYLNGVELQNPPESPDYVLTGKEDIKFYNHAIFINKDVTNDINFMLTVGCMAHEMIHEYTEICSNEMREQAISRTFRGVHEDSHFRPEFMHEYNRLLDLGIDALQTIYGQNNDELNIEAHKIMIAEDEILPKVKVKLVKDKHGRTCVDMRDIPPIDVPDYKEFTTGTCTRTIIYID